ncbi:MAG: ATP-binding protein [Coprobacillus sp.]
MDELALNILDIAYNSIRAHASQIQIHVLDSMKENRIVITIIDNGDGMDSKQVNNVANPFYTTRTTRNVGLGIPLLKQNAELTGGYLNIQSQLSIGTTIETCFIKDNIDTPMMGDLIETMATLIQADANIDYEFKYETDNINFSMDTKEMKEILGDVDINTPEVILWLKDYMKEGMNK